MPINIIIIAAPKRAKRQWISGESAEELRTPQLKLSRETSLIFYIEWLELVNLFF